MDSLLVSFLANDTINNERATEIAQELANLLIDKKIKLLDIILHLKVKFISENDHERKKSMNCLSSILSFMPIDILNKNDCNVIFNFYLSKLDSDEFVILETFNGLNSIIKFKWINLINCLDLLNFLNKIYIPTNYLAMVRYLPFQLLSTIFDRFFSNSNSNSQKTTTDTDTNIDNINLFINTYINVASGEKDPRNLLLSFQINKSITQTFTTEQLLPFAQKLFDILFSYFPITFKPPKDDPYKISNLDLKLSLRESIAANDIFATEAFNNLIDKLSSPSPIVKNDCLLTLQNCIKNFSARSCFDNYPQLWKSLKFEIIHNLDDSNDNETLNESENKYPEKKYDWTNSITSNDETNNSNNNPINNFQISLNVITELSLKLILFDRKLFDEFANNIIDDLRLNFQHEKDLRQSCCILAAIGGANLESFNKMIEDCLPLFFMNTDEIPKLKLLLMNLSFFLDSYMKIFGETDKSSNTTVLNPIDNKLNDYKDEMLMILGMALTGNSKIEVTVRTLAIIQFTKLIKMKNFLNKEEIALIVQYLTETILTDNNKHIYRASLEGLKIISEFYEQTVFDVALSQMLDILPLSFNDLPQINGDFVPIETILKIILDFTTSRRILIKESCIALTHKLFLVAQARYESSIEYSFLILSTIYSLFENNILSIDANDMSIIKKSIEPILFDIIKLPDNNSIIDDKFNYNIFVNVFYFINLKVDSITPSEQLHYYNNLFLLEYKILDQPPNAFTLIYCKIVSAIDKNTEFSDIDTIFTKTIAILNNEKCNNELEKLSYLELLMVLTNKWLKDDQITKYISWDTRTNINYEIIVWIGKGLVMKNSKVSNIITGNFISLLDDQEFGVFIARLFEIFVIDINSMVKYKGINYNNNVNLLYKQKFFSDVFKNLVDSYKESSAISTKCNYLTALSLILKHTASKLVEPFMEDLLPMLLEALTMENGEVRASSLETLADVLEKFDQLITKYVKRLIPLLLTLVTPSKENTVLVRLLSLKLLLNITKIIPLNYCLEYKEEILVATVKPLSDKKRVVRKQCIDTRQAYFELGQAPFE